MLSKNVPFWSVPAHIFETSGRNNITFGSQGDIGIIHSFLDFDPGMAPCALELLRGGGGFSRKLRTKDFRGKGRLLSEPALRFCIRPGLAIVCIDEGNPSKIFKMASNSFEVKDVPF